MNQSRIASIVEAGTNVAIGYIIALLSQFIVFPLYAIHVPLQTNVAIGLWFTAVSLVRSYVVRRWFNKRTG